VIAVAVPPGAPSVQRPLTPLMFAAPLLIVGSQSQHWLRSDPEIIGLELRAAFGRPFSLEQLASAMSVHRTFGT
jgi:hypothetical protein